MKQSIRAGIITSVFLMLIIVRSAWAQEAGVPLTLEQSIDIALKQSVIIQSAREGVAVSEARKKEAFTGFLPKLSTTYNYTHNDPAPYLKQLPPSPFSYLTIGTQDNYTWSLDARQPLFTGGRLEANYDISRLGVDASKHEEIGTVQDIVLEVRRSYFTIIKAERLVGVAKQSVEQFIAQKDLAKNFYEVGLVPRNDYLQAEVRLADGTQSLVRSENRLEEAHARFNTILRRPISTPVAVVDILDYKPYGKAFDECLEAAMNNRPEIQASALKAEQAGKKVKVVESEFYPSVNLVGSYQRYGDTADLNGSAFKNPDNWTVMAVASWDLWEWGRTKYARDASVSQEKQAVNTLTNVKDQVSLEVKNAWLAVKEAEKLIAVTQTSIEQAEENYRINQERYREQVSRMTDVLDALTLLTFARASYSNALSDYQIALAALERAMGVIWRPADAALQQ
ncbi:MAG TPA: TolC family protein [Syntrophales bacterium]|nr:TolC family protein [Syntrophales bacterium]